MADPDLRALCQAVVDAWNARISTKGAFCALRAAGWGPMSVTDCERILAALNAEWAAGYDEGLSDGMTK